MIKLILNNNVLTVPKGTTILSAAQKLNITIPTMCYYEGLDHFTSCMICVVQNLKNGKLVPACSTRVEPGMVIETDNMAVHEARKAALALLLSEHVGDCEAPCTRGCPANLNIPMMVRQIEEGLWRDAIITIKNHIPLPAILGRICTAPCEKLCRRSQLDGPIAICQLKKLAADEDLSSKSPYLPEIIRKDGKDIAIIGAGPAGLSCAYYLLREGHSCTIFDRNSTPGGSLLKKTTNSLLPRSVIDAEVKIIEKMGLVLKMNTILGKHISLNSLKKNYHAVILASGRGETVQSSEFDLEYNNQGITIDRQTNETSRELIFACGSAVHPLPMAVQAVAEGRKAAMNVHSFLTSSKQPGEITFNSKLGKLEPEELYEYLKIRKMSPPVTHSTTKKNGSSRNISKDEAHLESLRCLHCECLKLETCKLRKYADQYHSNPNEFKSLERSRVIKENQHPNIVYEPGKCIKCGICVRITEEHKESLGLTFIGRGFDVKVGIPFNMKLVEALEKTADLCVQNCPTGALSHKVINKEEKIPALKESCIKLSIAN